MPDDHNYDDGNHDYGSCLSILKIALGLMILGMIFMVFKIDTYKLKPLFRFLVQIKPYLAIGIIILIVVAVIMDKIKQKR